MFEKDCDLKYRGQPRNTIFLKGHDKYVTASIMKASWDSYSRPVCVSFDASNFDATVSLELLREEALDYKGVLVDPEVQYHLDNIDRCMQKNKGSTANGLKFEGDGSRASGEFRTSDGNCRHNEKVLRAYCALRGLDIYHVHVNGDDSLIFMEYDDFISTDFVNPKHFVDFKHYNMTIKLESVAYEFESIGFCQTKPVLIDDTWLLVREPHRLLARSAYVQQDYRNWGRYLSSLGLCELACSPGVPVLQQFGLMLLHRSGLSRPLGAMHKHRTVDMPDISIKPVSMSSRISFERAFGITVEDQYAMENNMGRLCKPTQKLTQFINKYKSFHKN